MHHDGVGLGERELFCSQAVVLEILLSAGQEGSAHALVLQAQHHYHIHVFQALGHVVIHMHTEALDAFGEQGAWCDHAHFRYAQRSQGVNFGARDARVHDIAHHSDFEFSEVLFVTADGEHIQQALGRVRVPAIAGVHHMNMRRNMACD